MALPGSRESDSFQLKYQHNLAFFHPETKNSRLQVNGVAAQKL